MTNLLIPVMFATLFIIGYNAQDNTTYYMAIHGIECWSDWFDRDDPTGTGDSELISALKLEYPGKVCDNPLEIVAQTLDGVDFAATKQRAAVFDTTRGFLCNNCDQDVGGCHDYKIRLRCPTDFCVKSECWTNWFNVDDPSGDGDRESIASLTAAYPDKICASPQKIEARLTSSRIAYENLQNPPVLRAYNTKDGFICLNADQKTGMCGDFQVRLKCPTDFCSMPKCFTEWFDRDDPTGSGDWEKTTDIEDKFPGAMCKQPISIEAQTTDGLTVASTRDVIFKYDLQGFVCRTADQPNKTLCQDYRIRFMCPPDFCVKADCWTQWFNSVNSTIENPDAFNFLYNTYLGRMCDFPLKVEERVKLAANGSAVYPPMLSVRFFCPRDFCYVTEHSYYVGPLVGL